MYLVWVSICHSQTRTSLEDKLYDHTTYSGLFYFFTFSCFNHLWTHHQIGSLSQSAERKKWGLLISFSYWVLSFTLVPQLSWHLLGFFLALRRTFQGKMYFYFFFAIVAFIGLAKKSFIFFCKMALVALLTSFKTILLDCIVTVKGTWNSSLLKKIKSFGKMELWSCLKNGRR